MGALFALKLRHPGHVFLLRGNHECRDVTLLFGFAGECQRRASLAVWEAVMSAFDALPLAALLGGELLCVHGGLSPHLDSLAQIRDLPRPVDVNSSGSGIMTDLLWADPGAEASGG